MYRLLILLSIFFCSSAAAQQKAAYLSSVLIMRDSLFWKSYNDCDVERFRGFFTEDVEFYHDKGGPLFGLPALSASVKDNLCKDRDKFRLRREAVPGSVQVYPLEKDNEIYGAVITGEHRFYVTEAGKPEYLTGVARFTHLWILKDGNWRMTRVISYDHRPVSAGSR